ncbi:MAG: hypothetical protein P4L50_03395 [Anaerolineaceae bacterium]|nr:hypothetical protein [Anaerolineaceae bacterium]
MRYAEGANYWSTTVQPGNSQGEIVTMLEEFGASKVFTMQGTSDGNTTWVIRFEWQDRSYHFVFRPLPCKDPSKSYSFGGKYRRAEQQAVYQMGRRAVNFVKALLVAADDNPDVLFGFLELPGVAGPGGMPATASELDVSGLTAALPNIDLPRLGNGK